MYLCIILIAACLQGSLTSSLYPPRRLSDNSGLATLNNSSTAATYPLVVYLELNPIWLMGCLGWHFNSQKWGFALIKLRKYKIIHINSRISRSPTVSELSPAYTLEGLRKLYGTGSELSNCRPEQTLIEPMNLESIPEVYYRRSQEDSHSISRSGVNFQLLIVTGRNDSLIPQRHYHLWRGNFERGSQKCCATKSG
ncbi:hypothetical protein RF11_07705 [Thelohanellus kitauei]|uniref:Uncharacterized protein n=1 Tax=Thelohanellus kitauei TaxID=669202 RepID=A0A0C2N057_THEKT|nr:hypothetical protein RF11_07705 [Thelohanellus kitauei]